MKLKYLLCLVPLGLTGCAGYNHTMFMTKSNVGLDFDSKPPTLEINVARKEAVIAPSFEGGKTPPVMASFKPSAGAGGSFGSFFMGVDQTFAGGDAALAMSQLYNQPTATDITKFNSAIELSKKPDYTDLFRRIPGEGKTRPFIFGTDTSLGLKAAWTGTGGQIPDTVKLGFNRKEFAWAPLTATPKLQADGTQDRTKVNVKMPAFLATVESGQKLDTNGTRVEALQYFATGDAATHLAMRQEVRAAMHARLDPNQKTFQQRFGTNLPPEGRSVALSLINVVYGQLLQLANKNPRAAAHVQRLDSLMPAELEYDFIWYAYDPTAKNLQKQPLGVLKNNPNLKPFVKLNSYVTKLTESVGALEIAVLDEGLASLDGTPIPLDEKPAKRQHLYEEIKSLQTKQRQILDYLDRHGSTLTDAVEFFYN